MTSRADIITLPHADLRKKSARIHVITDEVRQLIQDMKDAALDWEDSRPHEIAVALAAVSTGSNALSLSEVTSKTKRTVRLWCSLTPEVVKAQGELLTDHEGCLSVKNIYGVVPRYDKIRLKAKRSSCTCRRLFVSRPAA